MRIPLVCSNLPCTRRSLLQTDHVASCKPTPLQICQVPRAPDCVKRNHVDQGGHQSGIAECLSRADAILEGKASIRGDPVDTIKSRLLLGCMQEHTHNQHAPSESAEQS